MDKTKGTLTTRVRANTYQVSEKTYKLNVGTNRCGMVENRIIGEGKR